MERSGWHSGTTDTLTGGLARAVSAWPDRLYLDVCGQGRFNFREIDELSNRYGHGLSAIGVGPGTPVATMLENSVECVAVIFAILKLKALFVPLNTALKGDFLSHQIRDSTSTVLICESEYLTRFQHIESEVPGLKDIVVRGNLSESTTRFNIFDLGTVCSSNSGAFIADSRPADVCMLLYTSGTTGASKACMITHNYMSQYSRDVVYVGDLSEADILYACAPLFHLSALGMIFTSLSAGNGVTLDKRFSVSNFWAEIRRSGSTVANIFGAMVALLSRAEDNADSLACYGQIRRIIGMPFNADLTTLWQKRFGVEVAQNSGFGMSEACLIFVTPPELRAPDGSSGRCNKQFETRIFDDQHNECPPGVTGELVLRPLQPNVMFEGYWNRTEDTLKVFRDLWFHTGDMGYIDNDGWFFFVDRKKDYIRRRGENISTFEMEAVFRKHPAIGDVAVHAVKSELTEDDVKVTAVLKPGAQLGERELCEWAMDRVPYFALPRFIEFRDSLPYNASSKALKYVLRDEGVTSQTWDRDREEFHVNKK